MQALKNRTQNTEQLSACEISSFSFIVLEAFPVVVFFFSLNLL